MVSDVVALKSVKSTYVVMYSVNKQLPLYNNYLNFKTEWSMEFMTRRPCVVVPSLHSGANNSLRVINCIDPSVLKFNFFRP